MTPNNQLSGTQLILLSDEKKAEILRPELNIEKYSSFLFPHTKTKGLDNVRVMQWTKKLADGTEYDGEIKVEPSKTL